MYLVRNILQRLLFLFTTSLWNSNSQNEEEEKKKKQFRFFQILKFSPRNNFKTHVLGKFFNVSNLVCASFSNRPLFNTLKFTLIVRAIGHKQKKNLIVNLLVSPSHRQVEFYHLENSLLPSTCESFPGTKRPLHGKIEYLSSSLQRSPIPTTAQHHAPDLTMEVNVLNAW